MPELAEVEIVRQQLAAAWQQQPLQHLEIRDEKLAHLQQEQIPLLQTPVQQVLRHGKRLGVVLPDGVLTIHLRMTGSLVTGDNPRARLVLVVGEQPWSFVDSRRFGTVTVQTVEDWRQGLGPDLWDPASLPTWEAYSSSRAVKAVMLDQHIVAGVGNYMADESLWRAKIYPLQPWSTLSNEQRHDLWQATTDISRMMAQHGGVSLRDYRQTDGSSGSGQLLLECYGRKQQPCVRCGTLLCWRQVAGRGTTWCPVCQPAN